MEVTTMKSLSAHLESTFQDTRKPLLQMLKCRLGCNELAEDLVQETFLRVMQQNSIEEITNLPGYLFRIAKNLVTDHRRQSATRAKDRHEPLEESLMCPNATPETIAETGQSLEILDSLIADLPPRCRQIFLLHKVMHLSYSAIAEQLNISPRTVESQIAKAMKILRDRMRAV